MRSEREMYQLILGYAQQDPRVRGVILNGSRANPTAKLTSSGTMTSCTLSPTWPPLRKGTSPPPLGRCW